MKQDLLFVKLYRGIERSLRYWEMCFMVYFTATSNRILVMLTGLESSVAELEPYFGAKTAALTQSIPVSSRFILACNNVHSGSAMVLSIGLVMIQ